MFQRLCRPSASGSFFLFGARGTGKSTLLSGLNFLKDSLYLDLLQPDIEEQYSLRPELLEENAAALRAGNWIAIDEVQKIPKLLDVVHRLIESKKIRFALSGSSSRKLKRGGANLLAGRAFVFSLFSLTAAELGDRFDLDGAMHWGTLPKIFELGSDQDRARFLRAYAHTYVKEEILVEQLVRNLDPFRLFLPIAAQMNGKILNYSNVAKDTGVDYKTVQQYFSILEDTYLGFFLRPYSRSVRKVQIQSPKFYFFDLGVKRSLENRLTVPLVPRNSEYGDSFESWFINECVRLNQYRETDFQFSFLRTKDDAEIDLIVERPDRTTALVEIKSSDVIDERGVKSLLHFAGDFPKAELYCVSRVKRAQKIGKAWVLNWKEGLRELGLMGS